MRERTPHPEDNLPSIGWDTSRADLSLILQSLSPIIHQQSSELDSLTSLSALSLYKSVGIPLDSHTVHSQFEQFARQKPTFEQSFVFTLWYQTLKEDYPQLADQAVSLWKQQIAKIPDPFLLAKEAASILYTTRPEPLHAYWQPAVDEIIEEFAELLRERLPTHSLIFNALAEPDKYELEKPLEISLFQLHEFLTYSQKLNTHHITEDIEKYFIGMLFTLPLNELDAQVTSWLFEHSRTQLPIPKNELFITVRRAFEQIQNHPLPKSRHYLLGHAAHSFLHLGYWAEALQAWDRMTHYGDALRSIEHFVAQGAKDRSLELVRELYPALTKRNKDADTNKQKDDWNYFWWKGAQTAAQAGISLFGEPEVLSFVQSTANPIYLPEMVANIHAFPHEQRYRDIVKEKLTEVMKVFNRGYLDRRNALSLLKALLFWKNV